MSTTPDNQTNLEAPVSCEQVLNVLVLRWPEEPTDTMSPALLDHLCHCRDCLRKWIALEAATELSVSLKAQHASPDLPVPHLPRQAVR
jgi:hypothetical protein